MAFDVNSLGGKLIDNQNLAKALAEGGGNGLPVYTVTFFIVFDDGITTTTCDKTFAELEQEFSERTPIIVINEKVSGIYGNYEKTVFCDHLNREPNVRYTFNILELNTLDAEAKLTVSDEYFSIDRQSNVHYYQGANTINFNSAS